jgi:hypothetical protein
MSEKHRRLVNFAGSTVAIEYSGARTAAIIDFLYRYIPAASDVPPHVTYRVTSDTRSGMLHLYRDDVLIHTGDSEPILAELLMGDANYHLADRSRGGLLFHAAGLAWQGKGLILPGRMGAGKTTLAAWLVAQGLDYLTDELVFVSHGADTIQTLTRPLNVKKPSWAALQAALPLDLAPTAQIWSTPRSNLIPPDLLRPVQLCKPSLGMIVFPHYLPDSDFTLHPLSKAQAGLALMECLINARNLPGHGLSEIARLAQVAPAYKLTYADFDQIRDPLEALLQIEVASGKRS